MPADGAVRPVIGRKRAVFIALAVTIAVLVPLTLFIATDLYLHRRYAKSFGLNVWGYRGPAVGRKGAAERRIAVVGGSTAFGYGVGWEQSIPAFLERGLNERRADLGGPAVVVNLAYNNEGAHAFEYNLRDYESLGFDAAILYTGDNDLGPENTAVSRHSSGVFRLTGYLPIAPMIFQEKALSLRYGGHLDEAYGGQKPVFVADPADRMEAATLEGAAKLANGLERQLGRLSGGDPAGPGGPANSCAPRWSFYCERLAAAVAYALDRGQRVLVVSEPYLADLQDEQQRKMMQFVGARFGPHPRLKYINLGRSVDVHDPSVSWDGMHLRGDANARVAVLLVNPVIDLFRSDR